ncbi:MAG: lysozyme, partial [Peptococcaceae bacterium]|nr:lysozyme [Peptococcaceae bacterium]
MIIRDGKNVILSAKPENVIVAELKNTAACKNYRNCISGTFSYENKANAILISNGRVISNLSAHGWLGYPDSVIFASNDGGIAIDRLVGFSEERLSQVKWAVSGMGLLDNYNPSAEGYAKFTQRGNTYDYSDVLRKTNHTAIGVKGGMVYGFYLSNMTGAEVNAYVKAQGMEFAIMLDGGHIAAVNCDECSANASQKQHNILQFLQAEEKDDDNMRQALKISQNCIDLVKKFEDCRLRGYICPAGVPTIGYGYTGKINGKTITTSTTITAGQAEDLLTADLERFASHVKKFDSVYHWTQNEFDALVSFAYNVGSINQLTKNKTRTKAEISQAMLYYNKANGKKLAGLTKRRKAEQALFLKTEDSREDD